jgi:hypothetical protein
MPASGQDIRLSVYGMPKMEMAIAFIAACFVAYGLVWSIRTSGTGAEAPAAHSHGGHH